MKTDFEQAEKSWKDYMENLKEAKNKYHNACQMAKTSQKKSEAANTDPKMTKEQRERLAGKATAADDEETKALKAYQHTLEEIDTYKPHHIRKMTAVFESAQNFENDRMIFFKQSFRECQMLMLTHNDPRFEVIFEKFLERVESANSKNDLDWFSRHYGVNTQANWPEFEEYEDI